MTELRELLYDASAAAVGPMDLDEVLLEGRRRVRRRRLVFNGVAVATAAVVTAALVVAPRLVDGGPEPTTPEPVRLSLEDAVPVEPRVLDERTVPAGGLGPEVTYDGITEDGRVLLHRVLSDPFAHQAGLLAPRTGEVTWFDPVPTRGGLGLGWPLLLDSERLVFAQYPEEGRYFNVLSLDRGSGGWTTTRVETRAADPYPFTWTPFLAADGRVWFRGGENFRGSPAPDQWWSASVSEAGPAQLEETDAPGAATGSGRLVARVAPSGRLVVRDLIDGGEWSAAAPDGCSNDYPWVTAARILVAQTCPDGSQTTVFDGEGDQQLLVAGGALPVPIFDDPGSLAGTAVATVPSRGSFYVLDLAGPALYEVPSESCEDAVHKALTGGGLMAWCATATPAEKPDRPPVDVTYRVAELPTSE